MESVISALNQKNQEIYDSWEYYNDILETVANTKGMVKYEELKETIYEEVFAISERLKADFERIVGLDKSVLEFLTPSGRFILNTNLCFTNTGYHKEGWTPAWGIHEMIIGLVSFFYERKSSGIGHLHNSKEEARRRYAKLSVNYNQTHNSHILKLIDGSS